MLQRSLLPLVLMLNVLDLLVDDGNCLVNTWIPTQYSRGCV